MRTRQRNHLSKTSITHQESNPEGPAGPILTYLTPNGEVGSIETMTDEVTRNFKAMKRKGGIAINKMLLVRVVKEYQHSDIVIGEHPIWGWERITGDIAGCVSFTGGLPDSSELGRSAADSSLIEAYAKMDEAGTYVSESLLDLEKTIGMLRRPFGNARKLIGRILKAKKHRMVKTSCNAAKAFKEAWMEERYGWKPIMMDMDTIMQHALLKSEGVRARRLVARSGTSFSQKLTLPVFGTVPCRTARGVSGLVTLSERTRVSAGVIYDVDNMSSTQAAKACLGIRPSDAAAAIWESTPYSYVWDWFYNVGSWLRAIQPKPGVTVVGSWTTNVVEFERLIHDLVMSVRINLPPYDITYTRPCGGSTAKSVSVSRNPNPALPRKPVATIGSLSVTHTIDGLCLAVPRILSGLSELKR